MLCLVKMLPIPDSFLHNGLFGATAKNLKAKIDASLYTKKTSFPKFEGYSFDDPTTKYSTQTKTIFDGDIRCMKARQL